MVKADTPVNILVVDDNPKNIQVIGTVLRESGYNVGFAFEGKQALDLLKDSNDYDLVLLDIKMPVMNGLEVCKIMQEDERLKEIPVIFLSASHETESIIKGFDTGAVDYVTKPFNAKELLARVHTHVQLKRSKLELKSYSKELEKVNATKDKFFSIIAHDLRNPFEGILLVTRTLIRNIDKYSREDLKSQAELIATTSENGGKLLENLLLWSRSQTGTIKYNPTIISLNGLINKCIKPISPLAEAKNLKLTFSCDKNLELKTDEDMFCHVLSNLLTNAIKFTPEPGSIKVIAKPVNGEVMISVIDTGIGISHSDMGCLFRIDGNITSRPGTKNEKGSGLGLILCREFVDKMGGKIGVESEPDKGSTFTFRLPLN